VKSIVSVAGEDYHDLHFSQGHVLRIHLPDGRNFTYPYQTPIRRNDPMLRKEAPTIPNLPTPTPNPFMSPTPQQPPDS